MKTPGKHTPVNIAEEHLPASRLPLISCIMPTAGRPEQVAKSVAMFLAQKYPSKELIIVYNSDADLAHLPEHPAIRAVFFPGKVLGPKRNEACRHARGAIIAHWDDDDIYNTDRLSKQVQPILSGEAHITGLDNFVFYDALSGRCLKPSVRLFAELYLGNVHGGSLMYDRRIWSELADYPNTSLGEDAAFLDKALKRGAVLKTVDGAGLFIYMRHGSNTWNFGYGDERWKQVPMPEWAGAYFPGTAAASNAERKFEIDMFGSHGITNNLWRQHKNVLQHFTSFYSDRRFKFVDVLSRAEKKKAEVKNNTAWPLVSCVMPTAGRARFVARAIGYFTRQDYPNKELIVVYNRPSDLPVMEYPASVRLVQARTQILGSKRNEANTYAQGTIIAQWDDDDIYHGQRLSRQVEPIIAGRADITGLRDFVFFEVGTGQSYLPTQVLFDNAFQGQVAGGTLVYNRHVWDQLSRYPNYTTAEDYYFLQRSLKRGAVLESLDGHGLFVYIRHNINTWKFEKDNFRRYSGWQSVEAPAWAEPYLVNYRVTKEVVY